MSRQVTMDSPMCLIENRNGQELVINPEAERILSGISQPVVVVAIVGKYRTGKSYLMNKLASSKTGFPLGSTVQSKTKGIWMWCVPHPCNPEYTLVLLDTEGLGDVEKGDSKNDAWIFCLAVLLSSNFVYNSMGVIDQQAMEQIHYVTELTKRIKFKSNSSEEDESTEFKRIFPTFTWCVRDFFLKLEIDGENVTEDQYLMNGLKLKNGTSKKIQDQNLPRECILHYFHSHKCFVFERPASTKTLHTLEELEECELEKDFVEQSQKFCDYIFKEGSVKTLPGGILVTGRMLANLANTYVNTILSGAVPCMENAVIALSVKENKEAVQEALAKYEAVMGKELAKFPTETQGEFLNIHEKCEKEAIGVFLGRAFKDDNQKYQWELKHLLDNKMEFYSERNQRESTERCQILIQVLSETLEEIVSQGYFSKPGGYNIFMEQKNRIVDEYNLSPCKGQKSFEVLLEFLNRNRPIEDAILQSDYALTAQEKEIAEKQAQAEAAQREMQVLQNNNRRLEELMESQRRSQEQHERMLVEKMEKDKRKIIKENKRVMKRKMEEQRAYQDAGFERKCNDLQREIENLNRKNRETKSSKCTIS